MLSLGIKLNEKIWIGDEISIWLCRTPRNHKSQFRIAIDAPDDVRILRDVVRRRELEVEDGKDDTPS